MVASSSSRGEIVCDESHQQTRWLHSMMDRANPTKRFPPWTLHQRRKESQLEEQQYKNMQRRIKDTNKYYDNKNGAFSPHGNTLDRHFLLKLHCADKPCELFSVDISERNLNSVKPGDLEAFDNVAYIDASVNSLSLGSFSSFMSLRELNLSLNGICNMTFHAAHFPNLQVLDLSFNNLSADDIVSIDCLPRLKVLHLTGNKLHQLPPNLGSVNHDPTQQPDGEDDTTFKALEVLMLDDNKLSSGVFVSLANLKRRRVQNFGGRLLKSQPKKKDLIAEEEALMAAALFPMLRELDIHSNPLTTLRSGDPPLLTYYLHERLGITIKRKKAQKKVLKLPLKLCDDPSWKVEERIPKFSKKLSLMDVPGSSQSQKKKASESEGRQSRNDTLIFVTQATDVPEYECDLPAVNKETAGNEERLMDSKGKPSPDVVEPIGIQTAVRMLENTLRRLDVRRDSNQKLDCVQIPYRRRERMIEELPPVKPIEPPTERVNEMFAQIKESTTVTKVPLGAAVRGTGVNRREQKEALSLLGDIQRKHKMVHKKTMEQAAGIQSDRNTDRPPRCSPVLS
uniref:X-ray radiation resistance associated 1 n=1 Tax=Gasterosteus aculeatus aculeatus TaxID=481459 RepID=A0AAQ4PQJ3_GASAC